MHFSKAPHHYLCLMMMKLIMKMKLLMKMLMIMKMMMKTRKVVVVVVCV